MSSDLTKDFEELANFIARLNMPAIEGAKLIELLNRIGAGINQLKADGVEKHTPPA